MFYLCTSQTKTRTRNHVLQQVLPKFMQEKQAILKLTKREGMKELKKALYGTFSDIKI